MVAGRLLLPYLMENFGYQTPIRKKQTRILGMTIPQILLLAGLGVVQIVVLVLAVKYVFSPSGNSAPQASLTPSPTPYPTPAPYLSTAALTIDDMPVGFIPLPAESASQLDFAKVFPAMSFRPANMFVMFESEQGQFVAGWTFILPTYADRVNFDRFISQPEILLDSFTAIAKAGENTPFSKSALSTSVGEQSTAWTLTGSSNADILLFSHKNFGGLIMVLYETGKKPVIGVNEVAQKLDTRLLDVMVNGPVPTPVVVTYKQLTEARLTLDDLPAGFMAYPDSDINFDEASRADIEKAGMTVTGAFAFHNDKKNAEEMVMGFTFLFTDTLGKAVMDQLLGGDELIDAMFPLTDTLRRSPITINQPIGDRAMGTAIMGMSEAGGLRCDVLVFRREHAGAILFHMYHTGLRVTNVEDLAVKLDKKILGLAAP